MDDVEQPLGGHRNDADPRRTPGTTVFLDFPVPRQRLATATQFRTTWLASSLAAIRKRNLMERYRAALDPRYYEIILETVAGQWAPIEVALAHYDACDHLGLTSVELVTIGREVSERVHGSMLATVVKLAKQSGVTPWSAMSQFNRLWEKIFDGGGVCVYQSGHKDAVIEIAGWPLANKRYVRGSMPGVVEGMLTLFCRRAFVRFLPRESDDLTAVLRAQWA